MEGKCAFNAKSTEAFISRLLSKRTCRVHLGTNFSKEDFFWHQPFGNWTALSSTEGCICSSRIEIVQRR